MDERWRIGVVAKPSQVFSQLRRTTNIGATARIRWEFRQYCRVLTHVIAPRRVVRRASKLVRRTAQFSIEFSPQ